MDWIDPAFGWPLAGVLWIVAALAWAVDWELVRERWKARRDHRG